MTTLIEEILDRICLIELDDINYIRHYITKCQEYIEALGENHERFHQDFDIECTNDCLESIFRKIRLLHKIKSYLIDII